MCLNGDEAKEKIDRLTAELAEARGLIDSGDKVYRYADGSVPRWAGQLRACYCNAIIIPFEPPVDECAAIDDARKDEEVTP
jgi:hypothetical protein